jgi:peptidoglycan/xylan/chitin deacetylase (PgdA/CDA1 family)
MARTFAKNDADESESERQLNCTRRLAIKPDAGTPRILPISKRDQLAAFLRASGMLRTLEIISRRRGLLVINYHRIGDCAFNRFDDGVFSATTDAFVNQIRYLRENFELLSLDGLLEAGDRGFTLDRAAAVITFDDGYRDNFELAFPILRELGAHAFFFIPTDYIERPHLPWWDRIAFVLKHTTVDRLRLEFPGRFEVEYERLGRDRAIRELLRFYKTSSNFDEEAFFEHLEERAEVAVDAEALGRELFVSWDQVRQMREAGMAIGSHTHSHRILARLPEAHQRDELATSKARLESELGARVETVAYPVGTRTAFSELTKRLARETGYRLAFSNDGGINRADRTDPFDVRRITLDQSVTFPLFRVRSVLYNLISASI